MAELPEESNRELVEQMHEIERRVDEAQAAGNHELAEEAERELAGIRAIVEEHESDDAYDDEHELGGEG